MKASSISLAYFTDGNSLIEDNCFSQKWALTSDAEQLTDIVNKIATEAKTEWILFWDYALGKPDTDFIHSLLPSPIDVWHAGIKMGVKGLPDIMNYVDPTWMYNRDGYVDVSHSSFRLSLKACLVKVSALKIIAPLSVHYDSIEMLSLSIGYELIKSGAVMRYHPELTTATLPQTTISQIDEWKFAKQFYSTKWCWWIIFNKEHILGNINHYLKVKSVHYKKISPVIHPSSQINSITDKPTVSVLAPTLKRYPYLINELKQLCEQSILPLEVLITDQTDKAEREEIDFTRFPELTIRHYPQEEKGQCIAWNKLLEEAKGEYVLFLGDDADHITPDFIEKLLETIVRFDADMVASNVIEIGIPEKKINHHYFMADLFPITLIKKSVLNKSGFMDMFFNKNVRADHDLAMRCHLNGALMIFNPSATIHHHRAAVGGLRTHKARVVTNHIAKTSLLKFAPPTSSEIYLVKKYYSQKQYKQYIRIKYFNQLLPQGSVLKKLAKVFVFAFKYRGLRKLYNKNLALATEALSKLDKNYQ